MYMQISDRTYSLRLATAACLVKRHEHFQLRQPALAKDLFGEPLSALSCAEAHSESLIGREL